MAVYTEVSDEALSDFLEGYDIGPVLSFKGIAGGVENTNYMLQTSTGQFILTLYEKRVAEEDLPFFVGLMDHLASGGFPCPRPVRNLSGHALGRLCSRPAAIASFLAGVEVRHPTENHCFLTGQTMAQLHQMAEGFEIMRANALDPTGWPVLIDECLADADSVEPGLARLISHEFDFLQANWPKLIPAGVIHADMFKDNVFFLNDRLSGVIDFYFACNDFLAYDLAVAINAWCFDDDRAFMPEHCASLLAGYQAARKFGPQEIEALPVLARGAALRFLLTRLKDWLNVPPGALVIPHDPKEFSARLRFHQTVADASIYGAT